MLHEANDRHQGDPPVRAILEALIAPPVRWGDPRGDRRIAAQFLIRSRGEGTAEMRELQPADAVARRPDTGVRGAQERVDHYVIAVVDDDTGVLEPDPSGLRATPDRDEEQVRLER